jgi:predicted outer membrane repeat protein
MTALGWPRRPARPRIHRHPRAGFLSAARTGVVALESRILPAVFTVNSFADGVDAHPGDGAALTLTGVTTLRAAIMEANAEGGGTIILPAGSYTLSVLGANEAAAATGDLDILAPIAVQGAGSGVTTIHGDGTDRIFDVRTTQGVTVSGVTLTGGQADTGGAIRSGSTDLTLNDIHLINNQSTGDGGAIAVLGTTTHGQLTLNNALFQNNTAGGSGGAILMDGLTAVVSGATFANNLAGLDGGAIAAFDTHAIALGGAQITRATFSGNTAAHGGAAFAGPSTIIRLTDSTVTLNHAGTDGGGLEVSNGTLGFGNTIVAGNTANTSPDVLGPVASTGFNLVGDGSGASGFISSDQVGTSAAPIDPLLSPLILHGGSLPVHIPLPGSPALDVGRAIQFADERGFARPATGSDIGAVEAQTFGITSPSGGQHANGSTAFGPIRAVVTEGGSPLAGAVVTFFAPASGPSGTFAGSPTVHADASGIATAPTFTANALSGSYFVQVAASSTVFVDIPLVNDPALVGSLSLSGLPTSTLPGTPINLTVTALNPQGLQDGTFAGTITITGQGVSASGLPMTYTFQPVTDHGQKTFIITPNGTGILNVTVATPGLAPRTATVNVGIGQVIVTAPAGVHPGAPFAVNVAVLDVGGKLFTNLVASVTFASSDTQATFPVTSGFTQPNNGTSQFGNFVLNTLGQQSNSVTVAGVTVQKLITVTNAGPQALVLTQNATSIQEGQSLTVSGTFTDTAVQGTHTVVVNWGDGTADSTINLGPGVFQFQAAHVYADETPAGTAAFPINVAVTDAAGVQTGAATQITVTTVTPKLVPPADGIAIGDADGPLGQLISFIDPGADTWTATADYGDGTGPQPVPVVGHMLDLDHVYKAEGTYTVRLTLQDDDGGTDSLTERAIVFLPGTTGVKVLVIPGGQTGTLSIPGATVTLSNLGEATPAILLLGSVATSELDGLNGSPTNDSTRLVSAYDVRVLDPGPASFLTAQLTYPNGVPSADPSVLFFDKTTRAFIAVQGSTRVSNSFVVDKTARTATFVLGDTSNPTVAELGGTVFTLSVPAPASTTTRGAQSSANNGTTPFLLASAASASPALAGLGDIGALSAPIPTTGLVSSSTLTVAVSAAEGLVRGGGDDPYAGRLVTTQSLTSVIEAAIEIGDFLKEAFRMWLDQPAPLEAPAAIVPPPDLHDQIQLREATAEVAAQQKTLPADTPPVAIDAPAAPPVVDAVVAPAEERPWWLAAAPHRTDPPSAQDAPIPVSTEHEPTAGERAAAAVTAIWIGGATLAAVAPERTTADEPEPRPLPEEDDEEER